MEEKDELLQKAIDETCIAHRKIIEDWCQAYIAQYYRDNGFVNPGDFTLFEQVPTFDSKENCMVKRYWFEPKEKRYKQKASPD